MTVSRKSALQRLPAVLRSPRKKDQSHDELLRALNSHYFLEDQYAKVDWSGAKTLEAAREEIGFFCELAERLMADFIPAFRTRRVGGRRKTLGRPNQSDWNAAGGALMSWPHNMESFYQAQLVELVSRLGREKGQSQTWVFGWLVKTKNRQLLPRPYQSRTTLGSLKQAFGKICKRRRQNPSLKRPENLVAPEQKCLGR